MRSASTVGATPGLAGEKTRRRWPIARCLRQSTSSTTSTTSTKCVVPSMAGVPPGSVGAASDAAGLSHSHCGGDEDRRRYRQQLVQKPQHATVTGTSACSASARSTVALRCRIGASAFSTLIRQRPLNAIMRMAQPLPRREQWTWQAHHGERDLNPRVREQPRRATETCRLCFLCGSKWLRFFNMSREALTLDD